MHEGRASLTTAIINSLGYGIMIFSSYRPTAWFGGLLALTMVVAFLAEVLVVPAADHAAAAAVRGAGGWLRDGDRGVRLAAVGASLVLLDRWPRRRHSRRLTATCR